MFVTATTKNMTHTQTTKRNVNEGDPFEIKVTGTNLPRKQTNRNLNTTLPIETVDATSGTIFGLCWWAERPIHR